MCVGAGGTTSVEGLQGPETMLGPSSLEAATTLTSLCLDELQLAIERVDLGRDIENTGVRFVVAADFRCEAPIVRAAGQIHGLVIRGGLASDGVDEPHWKWLGGGITNVGGGGV